MVLFSYQGLDPLTREIRLVRLINDGKAVDDGTVFTCEIRCVSLHEQPDFIALSYTWGPQESTGCIRTSAGDIGIAENLRVALQHFQAEDFSSWLWVDAVCINQKDDREKSWQVGLMRDVYEAALHVMIWLGPAAHDSDLVLDRLEVVGRWAAQQAAIKNAQAQFFAAKWRGIPLTELRLGEGDLTLEQILSSLSVSDEKHADIPLTGTLRLLSRAWWTRAWVLQELWVAKTAVFHCGKEKIRADHIAAALTVFRLYQQARAGNLFNLPDGEANLGEDLRPYLMLSSRLSDVIQVHGTEIKVQLIKLLFATSPYQRATRRLDASDPRDRIFAMLGLSRDAAELGVEADYSKTCATVFTQLTAAIVRHHGVFTLNKCLFPKAMPGLPSWVIDWSALPRGYKFYFGGGDTRGEMEFGHDKTIMGTEPEFCACEGLHMSRQSYVEDSAGNTGILNLVGAKVDVVKAVLNEDVLDKFRRGFGAVLEMQLEAQKHYPPAFIPTSSSGIAPHKRSKRSTASSENERLDHNHYWLVSPSGNILQENYDNQTPEETRTMIEENPYLTISVYSGDLMGRSLQLVRELLSAVRRLVGQVGNRYGSLLELEDAIWRTTIADQQKKERDDWIRPATCPLSLALLMDAKQDLIIPGLNAFGMWALTWRLHKRLNASGLFSEFRMEAARDIIHNILPQRPLKLSHGQKLGNALYRYGALKSIGIETEDELERLWRDDMIPQETIQVIAYTIIEQERDFKTEVELPRNFGKGYEYLKHVRVMTLGRQIFVTRNGYLGLGPMHVKPDDIAFIVHDTPTPMLLRPKRSGTYELVGECYVHGIMNGEFVNNEIRFKQSKFELLAIK